MNNWEDYLDLQVPELFDVSALISVRPSNPIIADGTGFLLTGAEPHIRSNPVCADEFLSLVEAGRIEFSRQQRVVRLLFDVHQSVHSSWSRLAPLAGKLNHTLQVLGSHIDDYMREQGTCLEIDRYDIGVHYGYGGNTGAIRYGLSIARNVALCAFIRAFCDKFANNKNPSDFCGEWRLVVSDPTDIKYSKSFAGVYGLNAEASIIKSQRGDTWIVQFLHFPPFINWYGLEGIAYQAAVMAEVLEASVEADGLISD